MAVADTITKIQKATEPVAVYVKELPGHWYDLTLGEVLTGIVLPLAILLVPILLSKYKEIKRLLRIRSIVLSTLNRIQIEIVADLQANRENEFFFRNPENRTFTPPYEFLSLTPILSIEEYDLKQVLIYDLELTEDELVMYEERYVELIGHIESLKQFYARRFDRTRELVKEANSFNSKYLELKGQVVEKLLKVNDNLFASSGTQHQSDLRRLISELETTEQTTKLNLFRFISWVETTIAPELDKRFSPEQFDSDKELIELKTVISGLCEIRDSFLRMGVGYLPEISEASYFLVYRQRFIKGVFDAYKEKKFLIPFYLRLFF